MAYANGLVRVRHSGSNIVFDFDDGTFVMYDLCNRKTIGKLGKPTKSLDSQLRGVRIGDIKDKFEDEGFYNFLYSLRDKSGHYAETVSCLLLRAGDYWVDEGYVRLGIRVKGRVFDHAGDIPKDMLRFLAGQDNESRKVISQQMIKTWKQNEAMFQSILMSVKTPFYKRYVSDLVFYLVAGDHTRIESFNRLVNEYKCHTPTLVNYICNVLATEGIEEPYRVLMLLRDYHKMCFEMSNGKRRYDKYPRFLESMHAIATRNYRRLKKITDENRKLFAERYCQDLNKIVGNYTFMCPKTIEDVRDEAIQQQHCVMSYVDNVIRGDCHLVFMRLASDPDTSVLTIELVDGKCVHVAGVYNRQPTDEEMAVIRKYERVIPSDYMSRLGIEREDKSA